MRVDWRHSLGSAMAVFTVEKLAFLMALLVLGHPVWGTLTRFDARWYAELVEQGYLWPGRNPDGGPGNSNLAFFPLLPALAWPLAKMIGAAPALEIVAVLGSFAAAAGIYLVGRKVANPAVGVALVAIWGLLPRSHVQVMPYTEGLFTATAAFALYGILTRRWWLAGLMACLSGLTRPTGAAVIATVGIWALVALVGWSRGRVGRREALGRLAAASIAPLGFVAYVAYVGYRVGDPLGYFAVQRAWGSTTGVPWAYWEIVDNDLLKNPVHWGHAGLIVVVVLVNLAMFAWALRRGENGWLMTYAALCLLIVLTAKGYPQSKARFLLPIFPVWLAAARVLADLARRWQVLILVLALGGMSLYSVSVAAGGLSP
jgi:hypothetical protein